ncbi:hypothetical protein [Cystobacter ferrugineus]|nr:hypothetical protein [Cystobacter ferrugineus]
MRASEKERGATAPPGSDPPHEGAQPEESRSTEPDAIPTSPAGKANAGPNEQIEGYAMDTITDGDGNYLEPPD